MRGRKENNARLLWEKFYLKYNNLSPELPLEKKVLFSKKTAPVDIAEKQSVYMKAARTLQAFWRKLTRKDTLIRVNPHGNHTADFNHFHNFHPKKNKNVKKSINKDKLMMLLGALDEANWRHPIFMDGTLPELALSLFASGKITQQQIYTILERHQTLKDYPLIANFKILNPDGSFTDAAIRYLLPRFQYQSLLNGLTFKQIEDFRLMVAQLPGSEQYFYVTKKGKLLEERPYVQLGRKLIHLDAMIEGRAGLFHLSAGVRDALGLVRFGINEYVRPMPRLGQQTLRDIEQGVIRKARYAALNYPNTKPYGDIHGYKDVNGLEATCHDVYHGNVMSTIPDHFLKAFKRFIDISREQTGLNWSKEIWQWVDSDFPFFMHKLGSVPETDDLGWSTELFCMLIEYGNGATDPRVSTSDLLVREGQLTCIGALILMDMVKNKPLWLDFKINPAQLTGLLSSYYSLIEQMYDRYLKDEPSLIQVLKIHVYLMFFLHRKVDSFKAMNDIIESEKDMLLNKLTFQKRPKKKGDRLSNIIEFRLDNEKINQNHIRDIVKNYYHIHYYQNSSKGDKYYQKAILEHNYECRSEALIYTHLREEGVPDNDAKFLIKPTLLNWLSKNQRSVLLLSLTLVAIPFILIYGLIQTHKSETNYNRLKETLLPQAHLEHQTAELDTARQNITKAETELNPNWSKAIRHQYALKSHSKFSYAGHRKVNEEEDNNNHTIELHHPHL